MQNVKNNGNGIGDFHHSFNILECRSSKKLQFV